MARAVLYTTTGAFDVSAATGVQLYPAASDPAQAENWVVRVDCKANIRLETWSPSRSSRATISCTKSCRT
jgi:hypothetical protein